LFSAILFFLCGDGKVVVRSVVYTAHR
jgi:hypothetical protein